MRALVLMLLASCVVVHVSAPPRAPVYECAAEDGSGRTVRVEYSGDPVRLSERLADEPGGLWSCYRARQHTEKPIELRIGAAVDDGAALRDSSISDGDAVIAPPCSLLATQTQGCGMLPVPGATLLPSPRVAPGCESPDLIPSVNCIDSVMGYDGCHWGCRPMPMVITPQSPTSAIEVFTSLHLAATTSHGATCTPNPWRPLNLQECR